jgi:hypothetical protein
MGSPLLFRTGTWLHDLAAQMIEGLISPSRWSTRGLVGLSRYHAFVSLRNGASGFALFLPSSFLL